MRLPCSLLLLLFSLSNGSSGQNQSDQGAVRSIPQSFARAWNTHSGHELSKIMAEDVDFVNVGADWIHGRVDFEVYHARLLSGRFKASTLVPLETDVRFMRPDLAVIHWSWKVLGDKNEDMTPRKPRYGLFTMIAEKGRSGWLVVEAQNTNWTPGPNRELKGIKPPIVFPANQSRP
jgi:uncharacterized protein (TIGR02246 family)